LQLKNCPIGRLSDSFVGLALSKKMTSKPYFRLEIKYFLYFKKSVIVCAIANSKKSVINFAIAF